MNWKNMRIQLTSKQGNLQSLIRNNIAEEIIEFYIYGICNVHKNNICILQVITGIVVFVTMFH